MIKDLYIKVSSLAVFLTMALMPANAYSQVWYGDVNGDGQVNIEDVTSLIDGLLSGETGSTFHPLASQLSARDYGAVGDGVTDDTDALERLFADAFMYKKKVFLDPGTYIIRRSLTLRSGMEIYGDNATIKKKKSISTTLSAAAVKGQTYIDVANASGFVVGDQFFICNSQGANYCTYGIITEVDGNRIYFTNIISDGQSDIQGCVMNYSSGLHVAKSFALLRSWTARFECDGVYIHDLTLDGNRSSTEPKSWANSCIHIDAYYPGGYTGNSTGIEYRKVQRNLIARNLVIKNSPHDAISDQGEGGLIVADCVIENSAMHGVHVGTVYFNGLVTNNVMTGNGNSGAGVFFCQDVVNMIVDGNKITSFNHGCSDEEFGTAGKYTIIRNNEFSNIKSYVFDFLKATKTKRGGGLQISDNTISGLKAPLFSGGYLDDVIVSNNQVTSVTTVPTNLIKVKESNNVVIVGNTLPSGTEVSTPVDSSNTTNLISASNSWD